MSPSADAVLIGSGVMSANLGALLRRLDPKLRIQVYEAANELANESSNGWNNAGTGHAGICELSYTPKREADGTVKIQKVIDIFSGVRAIASVLGARGGKRHDRLAQRVHQSDPAHQLRARAGSGGIPASASCRHVRDGHIAYQQSFYSVPPEYVGCNVWLCAESRLVRLFNQRAAAHGSRWSRQASCSLRHFFQPSALSSVSNLS